MADAGGLENAEESPSAKLRLSAWCVVAAFGAYFCMYAFRKPFTAAGYRDITLGTLGFKSALITAQVLGYTLSKFLGIKIVAEIEGHRRAGLLLALIGIAEVALMLFGLTPAPWNLIWLFFNGVPLGMVFGLVLGFLEGRRQTEVLTAGLCASFIIADGFTKSAGTTLLNAGVSEFWMPFLTGLMFFPPLFLFTWMLSRIPRPSHHDVLARSERTPMDAAARRGFFLRYAPGLVLLVLVYLLVTILRSVRADFAPEIWSGLQASVPAAVFTWSEILVAAGVLTLIGSLAAVRDNRLAFFCGMGLAVTGVVLVGLSLVALRWGLLSPLGFMVANGIGLYLPYIAVHTTLFERLLAMTRDRGNIGFLMYLADSFGYLGYVAVLIARTFFGPKNDFLGFFVGLNWAITAACLVLLVPCWWYFAVHPAARRDRERLGVRYVERTA